MAQFGSWQLEWLGHDGFRLTGPELTIVIDPYRVTTGAKADYILITHDHYDHFDPASLAALRQINTVIIGPKSVTKQLNEMAVPIAVGETQSYRGLTVTAVPAYNRNKAFHPPTADGVGYILAIDSLRLYHAGDTDLIPEMADLTAQQLDLALLPVSGTYTMTATEAAEAAKLIQPKTAIPMHYGTIIGSVADAEQFAKQLNGICSVQILEKTV